MKELVYIAYPKNSTEIIESLETSFFLLFLALIFYIINRKTHYMKIFTLIFVSFITLNSAIDYYISSKLSNITKQALMGKRDTKTIEGLVIGYHYVEAHKREYFRINNLHFRIENNHKVFLKNYSKLLHRKQLKLKIEYIDFPKQNTTVIRIWKL